MKALLLLLGLGLGCAGGAGAQGLYKCKDAAGKITYSGKACALLGLQSAGEVKDALSTVPAQAPDPQFRGAPVSAPPPASRPAPATAKPASSADDDEDRRCFKTAKGVRCNDKPEEQK